MYFSICIFIFALLILFVFGTCQKRSAVKKVCSMTSPEKCRLFSSIIEPFGYCYDENQDIISSRNDAWQRNVGYTALFDHAAPHFNMVFDYLPVYFPYRNRTWLIEFWKGQYGINTGAEAGLYYADRILTKEELKTAHFQTVTDEDMLPLSLCLMNEDTSLASLSKRTWWLTAFCMGRFSSPSSLYLNISLRFPDVEMMHSFLNALYQTGLSKQFVRVCCDKVYIQYGGVQLRDLNLLNRLTRRWAQFTNRIFCRLYLFITRYFSLTIDRLLYLYYLLPFAFRRILTPRRYGRHKAGKNQQGEENS